MEIVFGYDGFYGITSIVIIEVEVLVLVNYHHT